VKTTTKYVLSGIAAIAVLFVVAPFVMAESGYKNYYHDGVKSHYGHWAIPVEGFVGSIPITYVDKETLKEQATVSLEEASEGLDVHKASLGVAVNENSDKFLVWKLVSINKDSESETATATIYIVDAGDADNTTTVTKEFDKYRHGDKWSHYKMYNYYSELTPEEREAKIAQHAEMKEAFSVLSDEDQETIMSYFKEMKSEYAELSEEEKTAKHDEMKAMMEEFMQLTLDEKIKYLEEFAESLRSV